MGARGKRDRMPCRVLEGPRDETSKIPQEGNVVELLGAYSVTSEKGLVSMRTLIEE
jgi:hypothetical protein